MRKDIEKLISEITILAIQISVKTDKKIFVDYSGHVNLFCVRCCNNDLDNTVIICNMFMRLMSNAEIKLELKKAKKYLEVLKNE